MKKLFVFYLIFSFLNLKMLAQVPQKLNPTQIFEKLQQLNFLGSALYIAAHPDDENTRLISYLANHVKARTAYLSLTRGDGGQNLIGPEISELLGVIRTQELLAARKIDGGEQLFTRANDFGFSKHPDETLKIWDKEKVLSDVVWAIRTFKPDIIINRFDHRTPGSTHGHHTSSAMLSVEAFDLAGNAKKYPNQLKYTQTWQPKRLFFNTSWWFFGSEENFNKSAANNSNFIKFDVGTYYPLKGLSNNEIAAIASSQHLCQGFGRLTNRGSQNEYVELLKGEALQDKTNLFAGINTTWNRIENGAEIGEILYKIEANFDFKNPANHIDDLLKAYQKIQLLKDDYWKNLKEKQLNTIIEAVLGLYLEASATSATATKNETVTIEIEAINRSNCKVFLQSITSSIDTAQFVKKLDLKPNTSIEFKEKITIKSKDFTTPYWLTKKWDLGIYNVDNQELIGLPETPRAAQVKFNLFINDVPISFTKNVVRRYAERDQGEIYEPFEIIPKITTAIKDKVLIFSSNEPKNVSIEVTAWKSNINGELNIELPVNWNVEPKQQSFSIAQKGDKKIVSFTITPPKNQSEGELKVIAKTGDEVFTKELIEIKYNHIPKQIVLTDSEAKIVKLNIQKEGNFIGYIKGAGDAIPESLQQIGYQVEVIDVASINENSLSKFDAIVMGVRAYNVVDELKFKQKYLLDFVKNGGNLLVQYNTDRGVNVQAPFELNLSRDRVTDENAKVSILAAIHPVLNFPNKILETDFDNWVQERGLYFPDKWSQDFTPIFSMNDIGESATKGSLLIAKYGKGNYIYTGLSFFRQLPAGVPGAYKLFANLLSLK